MRAHERELKDARDYARQLAREDAQRQRDEERRLREDAQRARDEAREDAARAREEAREERFLMALAAFAKGNAPASG